MNFGALSKAFPFDSQDGQILGRSNTRLTDINGDRLPDFIALNLTSDRMAVEKRVIPLMTSKVWEN